MYAKEIVTEGLRPLDCTDTGATAMVRMHEYNVNQLPVVDGEQYMGILSMDDLLVLKHLNDPIRDIQSILKKPYVLETAHLFEAMKAAVEYNVKVVPVLTDDNEYIGLITAETCMRAFAMLYAVLEDGGVIELSVPAKDYSLSEIARIAEDNGVKIVSSYTQLDTSGVIMQVTIKVNTIELAPLIAAFERYDYIVKGVYEDEDVNAESKDRYDALMRYLDV